MTINKYIAGIILSLALLAGLYAPAYSFTIGGAPNFAIGVGGSVGYYDTYKRKGDLDYEYGLGYGAGIIVERMFTNRFGLHTGLWGYYSSPKFEYFDSTTSTDEQSDIVNWYINFPLYLITSFNARRVSLNFLTGFNFTHVLLSELNNERTGQKEDSNKFFNNTQIGLAIGVNFKFRVGNYTDYFLGVIADGYMTQLFRTSGSELAHLYDARVITGFLFRTNLFPTDDFWED